MEGKAYKKSIITRCLKQLNQTKILLYKAYELVFIVLKGLLGK